MAALTRSRRGSRGVATTIDGSRQKPLRLSELPWGRIVTFAVVLLVIGGLVYSQLDVHEVHREAAKLPAWLAFTLLGVLPLIGFPASILHVAAGIRFGAALGLALVSLSIGLQLLASYGIVKLWRTRFERARWVDRVRKRIPKGAHASICVFTVLLPGAPYSAINYVLPLVGVPLRTFLACCLPLHTLRSTITVMLGDQSDNLTPGRLAALVAYALMIFSASWWMFRRMKRQFADQPPAADGPTPRA
jgi:uncharacterized membrane protein YdjX (TVP38/TMEM64 family)